MEKNISSKVEEETTKQSAAVKPDIKPVSFAKNNIVQVRIIVARNLDFVPDNHQLPFDPFINYPTPFRPRYISPIFEVPPSNLPRYLQFCDI